MIPGAKFFYRAAKAMGYDAPYEAARRTQQRAKPFGMAPSDNWKEYRPGDRREVMSDTRDLEKNSGFFRQIQSDMALYAIGAGILPQGESEDDAWNEAAEEIFTDWAAACDITGRFDLREFLHMAVLIRRTDGEVFFVKVRDELGRLKIQMIESHRVGNGNDYSAIPQGMVDGIMFNQSGAPVSYRFIQDDGTFRDIPASAVMHVYDPERPSVVRAPSPMQHSVANIRDSKEITLYEKLIVKMNSMLAWVVKKKGGKLEEDEIQIGGDTASTDSGDTSVKARFGANAWVVNPDEDVQSFESKRPNAAFEGFMEALGRESAHGSLPYDFAMNPTKVGGAAVRLVVGKAERIFSHEQDMIIKRLLVPLWAWVIGDAIESGILPFDKRWFRIEWVTPRKLSVDAGRDGNSNRQDLVLGAKTFSDDFAERGLYFRKELRRRTREAKAYLDASEKSGVPLPLLYNPAPASTPMMQFLPPNE